MAELDFLQANARLWSSSETDGHDWEDQRRAPFYKALDYAKPDVLFLQEADAKKVTPGIFDYLGWGDSYVFRGKVCIGWNPKVFSVQKDYQWDMPNGPEDPRRLVAAELQHIKTGKKGLFGSTHFGVHFKGEAEVRRAQARFVMSKYRELGYDFNDPEVYAAIAGDINDAPMPPSPGVRQVWREYGCIDVRSKLPLDKIDGESLNTGNGYKTTKNDGKWLDEFGSSKGLDLTDAEVIRTDPTSRFPFASDHNFLKVASNFLKLSLRIGDKDYEPLDSVSVETLNEARAKNVFSRHVYYMQLWLKKLGYNPGELDGYWHARSATQDALDAFRWAHRKELRFTDRKDGEGTIGVLSLSLLNDLAHSPLKIREEK
jgi:hypothetical protein